MVQDIVKLYNLVKAHGNTIKDLEISMPSKATKTEINQALSLKANITDVSRTVAEVAATIDEKVTYEDLDKLSLMPQISQELVDEVSKRLEHRFNNQDLANSMHGISNWVEDVRQECLRKFEQAVQVKEMSALIVQMENKADVEDVNESLKNKANK